MYKVNENIEHNRGIPNGLSHFSMVQQGSALAQSNTEKNLKSRSKQMALIGTCLCVLYQAATCHRKCHGGPHILESLCGRAYNQSVAAYNLIELGFYDEALSLVRGLGEIYHLVALSVVDKDGLAAWLNADKASRIRDFSPGKIRTRLRRISPGLELMPPDWYSGLSEKYTHVTPNVSPNKHNPQRAWAGGIYQEEGLNLALEQLTVTCTGLAMMICQYFKFTDLFGEISKLLRGTSDPNE